MATDKVLTIKEYYIAYHTYILNNLENLRTVSNTMFDRDRIDFENAKALTKDNEDLFNYINREIEKTKGILTQQANIDLMRSINSDQKKLLDSFDSVSDESFLNTFHFMSKGQSKMSDLAYEKLLLDCSHFNIEDEEKLGNQIISLLCKKNYFEFLKKELILEKSRTTNNEVVKWSRTKNDFYKLVYALFHSKAINSGEGEITKIMASLAPVFGIKLANSWASSASKNKDYSNAGFNDVQMFEDFINAYKKHVDELNK